MKHSARGRPVVYRPLQMVGHILRWRIQHITILNKISREWINREFLLMNFTVRIFFCQLPNIILLTNAVKYKGFLLYLC